MTDIRLMLQFVIYWLGWIINIAISIRVLFSWLPINTPNILYQITEPILAPIRRMLNDSPIGGGMMIDFSPVIAIILIEFVSSILRSIL